MPYPNEHSARLKNPDDFDSDSFRRTNGGIIYGKIKVPQTIAIIWGKLKGKSKPDDPPLPQALRFPTKNWTAQEAKKWLKDNKIKYQTFEPAKNEKKESDEEVERRFIQASEVCIEKRSDEDKTGKLIGYAAVFNSLSELLGFGFREKIRPGAFKKSIKKDDVRALVDHDSGKLLGRKSSGTLKLKEDEHGLRMEVDLPDTSVAKDIVELINRGDLTGASIGFRTISDEWQMEDGQQLRELKEAKLIDVSVVTFPAYPDTSVAIRSHEKWLESQKESEETKPAASRERMRMRLALAEK